jgi:OOP family OmpA-OmpF porin
LVLALACAAGNEALADPAAPIVVSGTVGDEAAKVIPAGAPARLVRQRARARPAGGGPGRGPAELERASGQADRPNLKLVSRGQLQVDGSSVSLRGDVASEAQRQQIGADIALGLGAGYSVNNGLRVAASEQGMLDAALADRIIEFESGQATLADSGKAILDQMSAVLIKLKDKKVQVIGHTDNAGSRAGNLSLSQARAEAVKTYVAARGINPDMIAVAGEGPDRPVADNRSPEGRARNRRIEFKIVQ